VILAVEVEVVNANWISIWITKEELPDFVIDDT